MRTVLISALCVFLLFACSDKEKKDDNGNGVTYDPPELAEKVDVEVVIPSADELEEMEDAIIEVIQYSEEDIDAYPLYQFVTADNPQLYVYEIVSDDNDGNWSPRLRGLDELSWKNIQEGYLLPSEKYRAFFPDDEIDNTYNVKNLGYLKLYRFVDVIKDGTVVTFQVGGLEIERIAYTIGEYEYNNMKAVPMTSFISDYVTTKKEQYTYLVSILDGEDKNYSWSQMEKGYVVDEYVIFMDAANKVTEQLEYLVKITLVEDARY